MQLEFDHAFEDIVELFGEHLPNVHRHTSDGEKGLVVLPSALYPKKCDVRSDLIRMGMLRPSFSEAYFKLLWRRYYRNVVLKKWNSFAKCDQCVQFRQRILTTQRGELGKLQNLKADQQKHREYISGARKRLKERVDLALDDPDQYLFICFDGMDSKKSWMPRFRSDAMFAKDLDAAGQYLKSKLTGFLMPGRGFLHYWTVPTLPHGANLTCTMLLQTLVKVRVRKEFLAKQDYLACR
jgi:hypothetical protein